MSMQAFLAIANEPAAAESQDWHIEVDGEVTMRFSDEK